ncbi:hypothetical protein NQ315_001119 [Exocentrus adspersus]|uniref:Glutathione S-transferase n=1 Tax=Exocentrus adspersus TaxID=1586481 RepID=A0AAV8WEA9_9CUCU|nr:hypothetical protein NQ315_001119 [Exocentrus adspersus]
MAPILYGIEASPPVRACFITIEALGIDVKYKEVNLLEGEHLKPEFLKINPLHTVPTLQDGDFSICDSHVITAYLVGKYGKDDSLYPKDLQRRAVVDQRMYFEAGILFNRLRAVTFPIVFEGVKVVKEDAAAGLEEASSPSVQRKPVTMPPILYGSLFSPPYRATLLTIQALGLQDAVEYQEVNTRNGDHLKPEYLKLNPLHTIPAFKDGDFTIWDSHVINAYLVDKYAKDDSLYPKDLEKRAVVDQRLFFDVGVLFNGLRAAALPVLKFGAKGVDKETAASLENAYNSLELLLERSTYVAGEHVTIADFSIVSTLTSANVLVPIASNRFPKISGWLTKMQALPYYAAGNQAGLDKFTELVKSKLA